MHSLLSLQAKSKPSLLPSALPGAPHHRHQHQRVLLRQVSPVLGVLFRDSSFLVGHVVAAFAYVLAHVQFVGLVANAELTSGRDALPRTSIGKEIQKMRYEHSNG